MVLVWFVVEQETCAITRVAARTFVEVCYDFAKAPANVLVAGIGGFFQTE
jgi:hypothetical protein